MPDDDFDDDDMFDGITEEDLQLAEFQASQQLQRQPPLKANAAPNGRDTPAAAPAHAPPQPGPAQHQQPARARPLPPPPPLPQAKPQLHQGRPSVAPVVPAKRAAPGPPPGRQQVPGRASPALRSTPLQPSLGRPPGMVRVQPAFNPPFKKQKVEPVVAHVPVITPHQAPSRPTPYHFAVKAAAAAAAKTNGKGSTADDPIDDLDDDEFWSNVDLDAEEMLATQQVRAGSAVPASQASASPEKRRFKQEPGLPPAPASTSPPPRVPPHRPPPSKADHISDAEERRKAAAEAEARAKAEHENDILKKELEKMRQELWSKQGEDKMLRQRLQKAEADKISLEREKERMRSVHQEELRKVNSQRDEDMKRMHDVAQFKAMEAETSRRTPQWPIRRPPSSVHRSGSQFRTPHVPGLRTPTKSAEKRRQEQERRLLSQDSPTRRANAAPKPLPAAFSGFDNSFVVPALPNRNKGKAPVPPTPARNENAYAVPETPRVSESLGFDDDTFEQMAHALSSPPRSSHQQTPKVSPNRAAAAAAAAAEPIAPNISSALSTPASWKLWARQVYSIRCANFVGDVFSFTCPLAIPVPSLPRSKLLPTPVVPAPVVPAHPLVIHRLMDLHLPEQAHSTVKELWQRSLERLLEIYTDAGRNLPESFFVHPDEGSLGGAANVVDESDLIFWSYQEQIEEAMRVTLQNLAALLRILSCILLRLCMLDALQDVLLLLSRTMMSSRSFVHAMLLNEPPLQALGLSLQDFTADGKEQDFRINALLKPPLFPRLLIEVVRKTYPVPLRVAHAPSAQDHSAAKDAYGGGNEDDIWDVGEESREEILSVVATCLQCFSLDDPQARLAVIAFVEEPGMVLTYIHAKSPPDLQEAMIQIMLPFASTEYEWLNAIACDFPPDLPCGMRPLRNRVSAPLIDVMARQLADGNESWTWEQYHRMHCNIVVFFSQLLIYKGDAARTFLGQSKAVLPGIIKSMHRDTCTLWLQPDLADKMDGLELTRVVDRICMNLRFLCLLCLTPTSNIDLAIKMREYDGRGTPHKGVRQLFNVAFGRIACTDGPDYVHQPDREDFVEIRAKLDHAYALANDILDKSLTPDEVANLFDQMGQIWEVPEDAVEDEETQTQEEEEDDEPAHMLE